MQQYVKEFPEQLKHALEVCQKISLKESENDILNIVIAGLGGSGIGGAIVSAVVQDEINIPIVLTNTYDVPQFVNQNSLVICSSFSGNTEETISAYHQAKDKGAKICVITSGGQLKDLATKNGDDFAILPSHIKSPRANLGYSVVQLLYVLKGYGLISESFKKEVENTIKLLEVEKQNIEKLAHSLAEKIHQKIPVIYSGDRLYAVSVRNQQQINENGKHFCHVNKFPEFNHNELVGWVNPSNFFKDAVVIYLKSDFDNPREHLRMKICKKVFTDKKAEVIEISAKGMSFIEQTYYLVWIFDYTSVFLAELNQADPYPVQIIDYLKGELAKE